MQDLKDYYEAIDWFLRAARLGSVAAQYQIGDIYNIYYRDGLRAVNWYRKAAQQGFWRAQVKLGDIYYDGMIVKEDVLEAVYWWSLAALNGDYHAKAILEDLYEIEKENDEDEDEDDELSQAEIKRRKDEIKKIEEVRRKIERAKTQKDSEEIPKQFFKLGEYYYSSYPHDNENLKKAFYWYSKSAEQEHAGAQCMLGAMYLEGEGVEQNYWEAVEYYHKAAMHGNGWARCRLNEMQKKGIVNQTAISKGLMTPAT